MKAAPVRGLLPREKTIPWHREQIRCVRGWFRSYPVDKGKNGWFPYQMLAMPLARISLMGTPL